MRQCLSSSVHHSLHHSLHQCKCETDDDFNAGSRPRRWIPMSLQPHRIISTPIITSVCVTNDGFTHACRIKAKLVDAHILSDSLDPNTLPPGSLHMASNSSVAVPVCVDSTRAKNQANRSDSGRPVAESTNAAGVDKHRFSLKRSASSLKGVLGQSFSSRSVVSAMVVRTALISIYGFMFVI